MDITLWTATLEESFEYSFKLFMAYLPKSLGALMLLGLGILLGKIVEAGTSRVLHMIGVDRLHGNQNKKGRGFLPGPFPLTKVIGFQAFFPIMM